MRAYTWGTAIDSDHTDAQNMNAMMVTCHIFFADALTSRNDKKRGAAMYDRREIDGAIAELEHAEPTMQRVLDAFMDALKRESPEAYKELLHDIKNIRSVY